MDTIKAIIELVILIIEIVLIVNFFISFKRIKELKEENQTIKMLIQSIYNKQNQAFEKQDKKIDEILKQVQKDDI